MEGHQEQRDADERARVVWPHFHSKEGDTRVIVDFPSHGATSCIGAPWSGTKEFYMSSDLLLATGSSVFAAGLSESNQRRVCRRRKIDTLPPGVKYILDMTPSLEGDDAAALVGDLSLPDGVRDWWMAKERLGVSPLLVSGHDDDCLDHSNTPVDCVKNTDEVEQEARSEIDDARKYKVTLGLESCVTCPARDIHDYCAVRHRANIIRLLLHINGHDLVLNSAPRVYTIVALAKQLDVVNLVSSSVRLWLEDHRNSSFVDIHPEIAIEMAWKLRLHDLARASLRVLVIERALEPANIPLGKTTMFGRPRANLLSDDISEVIQHATNRVRERVKDAANRLAPTSTLDTYAWLQIPAWKTLIQVGAILDAEIWSTGDQYSQAMAHVMRGQHLDIVETLVDYIKAAIEKAFSTVPFSFREAELNNDRRAYIKGDTDFIPLADIIAALSNEQKLMLPFFWQRLKDETWDWDMFYRWTNRTASRPSPQSYLGDKISIFAAKINQAMSRGLFPALRAKFPHGFPLDISKFHEQICTETKKLLQQWVPDHGDLETPLHRSSHLALGFAEDEFKFLPLWAGGLDDETGAVFDDMIVPDTDMGPNQPGPAYITGKTIAPSSTADSDTTIVGEGVSLQAVPSGISTGEAESASKATESFVEVSTSGDGKSLDDSDVVHDETASLEEAMRDIGIFSDTSNSSDVRGFEYMDDADDAQSMDDAGDAQSMTDDAQSMTDDAQSMTDDAQSMAADPGDVLTDSDTMSLDFEWSDIYD
ncbi:hypothetical protein SCAR479_03029 [Seiridium cardinale]|uniref:Uncharacterized protein n=1 Tax=Seiridium cardinale TaxID=138064 RepID=A0ABR2Y1E1_9PEZI